MEVLSIKGFAAYYNTVDYQGDLIQPYAFITYLKKIDQNYSHIKLLCQHNSHNPLGKITYLENKKDGLYMEAKIFAYPWNEVIIQQIKDQLMADLSIGFVVKNYYYDKKIRVIKEADLLEISVVTIGANNHCKIMDFSISEENVA
jgi:HK97 family phage prohead protease